MDDALLREYIEQGRQELDRLLNEQDMIEKRRAEIDQEIANLAQRLIQLSNVLEPENAFARRLMQNMRDSGLTNAIREIYKAAGSNEALGAVDVKKRLEDIKFKSDYQNILATIHLTINRLLAQNEILEQKSGDGKGKKVYFWNPLQAPKSIYRTKRRHSVKYPTPDKPAEGSLNWF